MWDDGKLNAVIFLCSDYPRILNMTFASSLRIIFARADAIAAFSSLFLRLFASLSHFFI